MKYIRVALWIMFLAFSSTLSYAQNKSDKKIIKQLKADIYYLASDSLEGRLTGSAGEHKAADYIVNTYQKEGIGPYKTQYQYPFDFIYGKEIATSARINIAGKFLSIPKEAFPLPFSADGHVKGEALPDVMESGNVWMLPLYQKAEEAKDPHFNWEKYAHDKTEEATKLGATALLFYDSFGADYPPFFNKHSEYEHADIPVAVISWEVYQKLLQENAHSTNATVPVELDITIDKTKKQGTNVAAYIDNHARYTVVLGAHYDHLGYGEDGNSLYTGKEKMVHNGADDNASGTAALLQLASMIKEAGLRNYNYLFVNFSGEELGLFGSKAFIKDQQIDSAQIAYMINMDMVGRLIDSTHALTVGGFGTSPVWSKIINIKNPDFKIGIDSSGVGPSDHTSFYEANIPVLFFFTGAHSDYHKPSDDADKINYKGEALVMEYIFTIVKKMDALGKPAFTKTKQNLSERVRFNVTLGIIPDYSYQTEDGLRVDGVSEGRPASKSGMKTGDVIVQMGEYKIKGIESYMEALAKFSKGDHAQVKVKRGEEILTLHVIF